MPHESGHTNEPTVGAPVLTPDGDQLGTVKEVQGRYFKVNAPMQPDYWLSTETLRSTSEGQVVVTFAKDRLGDYKVENPADFGTETGRPGAGVTSQAGTVTTERRETYDTERERPMARTTGAETGERVQLREEELRPRKEQVQAGEVGIRKEVVEEEQAVDVPVRREEVVVERRPVEGRPPAQGEITEGEEIRVPVMQERATVDKEAVVKEEVSVGKREVEDTERVSDTVRREEARLERQGQVETRGGEAERNLPDTETRPR